jgi:hypothetical protein
MPKLYKTETTTVQCGYACDKCGETSEFNDEGFSIHHTCGYWSKHDMTVIDCILCDNCLYDLIKDNIPNAKFKVRL